MLDLILLLAAAAMPASSGHPPERIATLVVYGDDPCPTGATADEIVVCARKPESDRYRIPKRFRDAGRPQAQAWTNRVAEIDRVSRAGAGLPDSCSPIGSGGQTGCFTQFVRDAHEQRVQDEREAADVP